LSSFKKRQSVPSARISFGVEENHAHLVQPKRVEPQGVLGVVFAPAVVGDLVQRLQRVVEAPGEPGVDQLSRGLLRLGGAEVRGLENGPQVTLGGDRMTSDEVPSAVRRAAEVVRPGLVRGRAEDHSTHLAGAQLLRLGREPEKGIDSPLNELLQEVAARAGEPVDVRVRVEPDVRRDAREQQVSTRAERLGDADPLALQVADGADGLVREQLVAADMHPRQGRDRLAGIHVGDDPGRGLEVEINFAAGDRVAVGYRHVADVGEPFRTQQGIGDVARRDADRGDTGQAEGGHLRRRLVREGRPGTK
jgi:hypothetical protein